MSILAEPLSKIYTEDVGVPASRLAAHEVTLTRTNFLPGCNVPKKIRLLIKNEVYGRNGKESPAVRIPS
jgi:hypothetical protein